MATRQMTPCWFAPGKLTLMPSGLDGRELLMACAACLLSKQGWEKFSNLRCFPHLARPFGRGCEPGIKAAIGALCESQ